MPNSSEQQCFVEALETFDPPIPADDIAAAAMAVRLCPELLEVYRIAWRAKSPAWESIWPWMEPWIDLHREHPDLDALRVPGFRVALRCHNLHAQHPIILDNAERHAAAQLKGAAA